MGSGNWNEEIEREYNLMISQLEEIMDSSFNRGWRKLFSVTNVGNQVRDALVNAWLMGRGRGIEAVAESFEKSESGEDDEK